VRGNGIAVMVIVKEPAVKAGITERDLDRGKVHTGDNSS